MSNKCQIIKKDVVRFDVFTSSLFLLFYHFLCFHHQQSPIKGLLSLLYSALALPEKVSMEAPELYNRSIQISW